MPCGRAVNLPESPPRRAGAALAASRWRSPESCPQLQALPCQQQDRLQGCRSGGRQVTDPARALALGAEGTWLTSGFPRWESQAPSLKPFNGHQTVSTTGVMSGIVLGVTTNPNRKLPRYVTRSSLRKIFSPLSVQFRRVLYPSWHHLPPPKRKVPTPSNILTTTGKRVRYFVNYFNCPINTAAINNSRKS